MLPIDKEENCKRMIETGKYQIPRSRGKEDKWLFAYLKKNGIGRNEAYQIWLPIFQTRHFSYRGQSDPTFIFNDLWENTQKVRFKPREEIVFYEKEISFLKSLCLPRWEKEFFMMLFATIKARGVNRFYYLYIGDIIKFTSISGRRGDESYKIFHDGLKNKVFKIKHEMVWNYKDGKYNSVEYKTIPLLKTNGEERYRFKSIVDVPDCFNEMFGFRVCENCGKEFEAGPKCQRNLCKECYKTKRRKNKTDTMKKLRCGHQ